MFGFGVTYGSSLFIGLFDAEVEFSEVLSKLDVLEEVLAKDVWAVLLVYFTTLAVSVIFFVSLVEFNDSFLGWVSTLAGSFVVRDALLFWFEFTYFWVACCF